jgi:hypothetical protein
MVSVEKTPWNDSWCHAQLPNGVGPPKVVLIVPSYSLTAF